ESRPHHSFLLSFLFLLYFYLDPQDLLSFPTRRSSDLVTPAANPAARAQQTPVAHPALQPAASAEPYTQHDSLPPHVIVLFGATGDRKSTRLNSSHVSISYAVFCLKKKKSQKVKADQCQ